MTIGTFIGEVFPAGDSGRPRLLRLAGNERGVRHRHGRGANRRLDDGQATQERRSGAKELLYHFGTPTAQEAFLVGEPERGRLRPARTISRPSARCSRRSLRQSPPHRTSPSSSIVTRARSSHPMSPVQGSPTSWPIRSRSIRFWRTCRLRPRRSSRVTTVSEPACRSAGGRFSYLGRNGREAAWHRQLRFPVNRIGDARRPRRKRRASTIRWSRPLGCAGHGRNSDLAARGAGLDSDHRVDRCYRSPTGRASGSAILTGSDSRTTTRSSMSSTRTSFRR